MGGIHIHDSNGRALGPLDIDTAILLIQNGFLLLPPLERIEGVSKISGLTKCVAIIGLGGFILTCILRMAEKLPMANFEIMAFAHSLIAIFTFWPWWAKPMNVDCPERVSTAVIEMNRQLACTHRPDVIRVPGFYRTFPAWQMIYAHIFGNQDSLYDLRYLAGVPTFWSGDPANIFVRPSLSGPRPEGPRDAYYIANLIGLPVITLFGLIHCIAWNSPLNTQSEQLLWRGAAATVAAVPLVVIVSFWLTIIPILLSNNKWPTYILAAGSIPTVAVYIVARILLLVLSCISLRQLPIEVYDTGNLPDWLSLF